MDEKTQGIQFDEQSKQALTDVASTVGQTYEDLSDIGKQVDYSKMTLDQLANEFGKFHKEYTSFKWEVRKIIAVEIEKQVKPLADEIAKLTASKPRFIYVKLKFPIVDKMRSLCATLIKYLYGIIRFIASPFHRSAKP